MSNQNTPTNTLEEVLDTFGTKAIVTYRKDGSGEPDYQAEREKAIQQVEALIAQAVNKAEKITGDTSDGFHTFNELYEFRMLYNAHLFNEWDKHKTYPVLKSKRHADGQLCFGCGWFIVMAQLPSGQISNHYENKYWDLFDITAFDVPPWEFDGHTAQDVAKRLRAELNRDETPNQVENKTNNHMEGNENE